VTTKDHKPHQNLISTTAELLEVEPQPIVRARPGRTPPASQKGLLRAAGRGSDHAKPYAAARRLPSRHNAPSSRRSIAFRLGRVGPLSPVGAKSAPMRRTQKRASLADAERRSLNVGLRHPGRLRGQGHDGPSEARSAILAGRCSTTGRVDTLLGWSATLGVLRTCMW
jgi:hypothetical protein